MSDLDIPSGPKTPDAIRRIAAIAIVSVALIIFGSVIGIPFLDTIGEFVLENLLLMGSVVGFVLFLIAAKDRISEIQS
ncbi:hypothetical protein EXE41_16340 [Halorubrum sp. SD690R]|jgi:hypothetical protein|uniref:hypothetical protein n=1 Tax=Halorubrum sp. SD690R TaxID=2518117 RepID=UPI0010F4D6CE|nr:hypothetical protein [Halorubrum sp. SD690R]TKX42924.1 hypothetical protein EXE41_16340 [Halorubrum sp. SD690R]